MSLVGGPGGPQGPLGGQMDISKTTPLICKCGNYTFTPVVFLREVSALISPNGQAGILPIQSMACNACGAVPDQMIHSAIRNEALAAQQTKEPRTGQQTKPSLTVSSNDSVVPSDVPSFTKSDLTLL